MPAEANLAIIKTAYQRWVSSRGKDARAWLDIMDDDIEFNSPTESRLPIFAPAKAERKAAIKPYIDYFGKHAELEEYRIERIEAVSDIVVALSESSWMMLKTGRRYRTRTLNMFWLEDGLITRLDSFFDTAGMMTAIRPARRSRVPA